MSKARPQLCCIKLLKLRIMPEINLANFERLKYLISTPGTCIYLFIYLHIAFCAVYTFYVPSYIPCYVPVEHVFYEPVCILLHLSNIPYYYSGERSNALAFNAFSFFDLPPRPRLFHCLRFLYKCKIYFKLAKFRVSDEALKVAHSRPTCAVRTPA